MERLGIILDVTHLCDDSFRDALDHFSRHRLGQPLELPSLVPHDRQFTDDQIRELIDRGRGDRRRVRRLDARARVGARRVDA